MNFPYFYDEAKWRNGVIFWEGKWNFRCSRTRVNIWPSDVNIWYANAISGMALVGK